MHGGGGMRQWCVVLLLAVAGIAGELCYAACEAAEEFAVVRIARNKRGRLFVVDKDKGEFERLEVYAIRDREGNISSPYRIRGYGENGGMDADFGWCRRKERALNSKAAERLLAYHPDFSVECASNLFCRTDGLLCPDMPGMQFKPDALVLDVPIGKDNDEWTFINDMAEDNAKYLFATNFFKWGRVFRGMWKQDWGNAYMRKGKGLFHLSVAMYSNGDGKFAVRYGIWPRSEDGAPIFQTLENAVSVGSFSGHVDPDMNNLTITESDTNGVSAAARIVSGDKFSTKFKWMQIDAPGYTNEIIGASFSLKHVVGTQIPAATED